MHYCWLFPRDLMNVVMNPRLIPVMLFNVFSGKVFFDMTLRDWRPAVSETIRFLWERKFMDRKNRLQFREAREIQRLYRAKRLRQGAGNIG